MTKRLKAFQQKLKEKKIDAAVIGPTTNMDYLLGGTPHADERLCILVVTPDDAELIAPKLNVDAIKAFTQISMSVWEDADGPDAVLTRSLLRKISGPLLAVDGLMRSDFLLTVNKAFPEKQFVPANPIIGKLRIRKTAEEITALEKAAAQADRAMQAAVDACRPGITEAEVAWITEAAFRKDGAEKVEFTLIAAGENGASPHHHSGNRILKKGDGIIIDIGASLHGYKSDITRMVYLGEPDKKFQEAYDLVNRANEAGRAAVKPGVSAETVDQETRRVIDNAGYGDQFIHRTGHGIGLDIHEEPYIQNENPLLLEEGMTFSVEPGVYFSGNFGIRIEDIVAVTKTGQKTLTGFDHALVIKS